MDDNTKNLAGYGQDNKGAAGGTFLIVAVTGRPLSVCISHDHQLPNGLVNSSGKYFTTHNNGFGAA